MPSRKPPPFGSGPSISVSLVSVSKRHASHLAKALDLHRLRWAWAKIAREISRRKANDVSQRFEQARNDKASDHEEDESLNIHSKMPRTFPWRFPVFEVCENQRSSAGISQGV